MKAISSGLCHVENLDIQFFAYGYTINNTVIMNLLQVGNSLQSNMFDVTV
jgi:hypothetical protein